MGSGVMNELVSPDLSDPAIINALKVLQIINMAGGLLLPAIIYLWLIKGISTTHSIFSGFPRILVISITAILFLAAQPFISFTNDLNGQLHLPASLSGIESWMQNMERQAQLITDAFLATTSIPGLLINIFMIALLPAIAEEIVFRGVLARLFSDWTHSKHWAVIISSLIFAGIHLQFYGFLPRFLLGMCLGYLFFWSGNLWLPVIAHFTNNLLSVIVEFLYRKGILSINADQFGFSGNMFIVSLSLVITIALIYTIRRRTME
jgi:uncharacterized protein